MEPGGSLPYSQESATCPYPESAQSSPCPPSHFLKIRFNIILPPTPGSPKWSPSLRFPHQNPACTSLFPPHVLHSPPISFSIWLSSHIWWWVQVTRFLVMYTSLLQKNLKLADNDRHGHEVVFTRNTMCRFQKHFCCFRCVEFVSVCGSFSDADSSQTTQRWCQ
jgi:hypothetical protein